MPNRVDHGLVRRATVDILPPLPSLPPLPVATTVSTTTATSATFSDATITASNNAKSDEDLRPGSEIRLAIIFGVIVLCAGMVSLLYWFCWRRYRNKPINDSEFTGTVGMPVKLLEDTKSSQAPFELIGDTKQLVEVQDTPRRPVHELTV